MRVCNAISGLRLHLTLEGARGHKAQVIPQVGDYLLNEVLPVGFNLTDELDNRLTA